jgi:hypothetical protein
MDFSNVKEHTKYFSSAECHRNLFDSADVDFLTSSMFRNTLKWRLGESGNIFFSGNFKSMIRALYPKFDKVIDLSKVTGIKGNFFITPHQYGFHTDMPEDTDSTLLSGDVAYKSILIPLFKLPETSKCHIFYFNERLLCGGVTLDKGPTKSHTHYKSFSSYEDIDCIYDLTLKKRGFKEMPFDQEVFDTYNLGSTSPIERYSGFSIENVFDWESGDCHVFDTTQLHCSNEGLAKKMFKNKAGLRISLFTNFLGQNQPVEW